MKGAKSAKPYQLPTRPNSDMDINGSAVFRHRRATPGDRFLSAYPRAPQQHTGSTTSNNEDELNEDDIFSTGDFSEASNHHHHPHSHNSPPSSNSSPRHHQLHSHSHKAFAQPESFGILAALPEHKTNSHHHLYQKTALSSPSSSTSSSSATSSSRFIPSIPKPPQERVPISASSSSSSKFHQPQSAPVNVPALAMAMRRRHREFDEIDEDEEEGDREMLPPHEIVARTQSPMLACSVLEGVGRTLKGRDLRQVRNAVWRRTGFLD